MPSSPLLGLVVVEFSGLAPAPFAGLILADWGASVIRIDRVDTKASTDILSRNKRSLAVNIKSSKGRDLVKNLISRADVLIDPYRPGILEKLGFGPDLFLSSDGSGLNERLIYARISGFDPRESQRNMAGHDINYIAQSGILSMLPGIDKPTFPLNLLADFGGGGMMCAFGILLSLLSRVSTGKGQIVDTDMISGTRYLSSFPFLHLLEKDSVLFGGEKRRGTMVLDGGAPFYDIYRCKDGKWMALGCLEPRFFDVFLQNFVRNLQDNILFRYGSWRPTLEMQSNRNSWPRLRLFLEEGFLTKTRDEWTDIFFGTDSCATPVLSPAEAAETLNSKSIPEPHPRLSRTPALPISAIQQNRVKESVGRNILIPGQHTKEILSDLGLSAQEQEELLVSGIVTQTVSIKGKL